MTSITRAKPNVWDFLIAVATLASLVAITLMSPLDLQRFTAAGIVGIMVIMDIWGVRIVRLLSQIIRLLEAQKN